MLLATSAFPTNRMELGLAKDFHTGENPFSCGGNSSFIRKKLQFHTEETLIDPVGRGQKVNGLSEKRYLRAMKALRSCRRFSHE